MKMKKRIIAISLVLVMLLSLCTVFVFTASANAPLGDVNGDGKVTISDAIMIFRYLAGKTEFTDEEFRQADLNGDGDITIADAIVIFRYLAGKSDLPVDEDDIAIVDFKADTIDLLEKPLTVFEYSDNKTTVTLNSDVFEETPKIGDIIILPPDLNYPGGRAIKVKDINIINGEIIIAIAEPSPEEVFENVEFDLNFTPDTDQIIELFNARQNAGIDDFEDIDTFSRTLASKTLTPFSNDEKIKLERETDGSLTLSLNGLFNDDISLKGKINLSFGEINVNPQGYQSWNNWASININIPVTSTVELTLKGEFLEKEKDIAIGIIPIPTPVPGVYIEMCVNVNLGVNGSIEIGFTHKASIKFGLTYTAPVSTLSPKLDIIDFPFPTLKLDIEVSGSATLQLKTSIKVLGFDTVTLTPEYGIGIKTNIQPTRCSCSNFTVHSICKVSASVGEIKGVYNFYDENNADHLNFNYNTSTGVFSKGRCPHMTWTLSGTVKEKATNAPISGVTVKADDNYETQTDENGKFTFVLSYKLPNETYLIELFKTGYTKDNITNYVGNSDREFFNMSDIFMVRGAGQIIGKALDISNSPLSGVTVRAIEHNSSTQTDINGEFTLTLPAGESSFEFSKHGYETIYDDIEISSSYPLDYTIWMNKIPVTGMILEKTETVGVNETVYLIPIILPLDAIGDNMSWTSSDTSIATVDRNGLVTGIKAGVVKIKATVSGFSATCEVTVGSGGNPNFTEPMISAGGSHIIALKSDGTVWAWGHNYDGQLGDGTKTDKTTPVQVSGLTGIVSISAGYCHTIALKSDGTVWAWGYNYYGHLGDGTKTDKTTPVQVLGENGIGYFNVFN